MSAAPEAPAVAVERDGPVLRLRLDRPAKLNAFDAALVDQLAQAVAEPGDARLIVISANGKGFSGGLDLGGLDAASDGDLLLRLTRIELLLQAVAHAPCATLALVHGPCYGAAADLVAACQWRVAAPDARFRMPGSRFGVVLGTRRLAALAGADAARRLVLREKPFTADEALAAGFVTRIAGPDDWPAIEADVLAQAMALAPSTFAALSARMAPDTRDADLAALVRSCADGSLKARVKAYVDEVAAAAKARKA